MNKKFSRDDSSSLLQALGQTIHSHRDVMDLTQEQLAGLCGLHRTYISDIERGARNPSLITIHRIARALGVTVASMLHVSEEDDLARKPDHKGDEESTASESFEAPAPPDQVLVAAGSDEHG